MSSSFLDFVTRNHDTTKKAFKSLSYDTLQLRKIRALYGRRGTFEGHQCHLSKVNSSISNKYNVKRKFSIDLGD